MYFVVLYFDSSKRQQSLTEHLNVRGAQRFQTPSYILSPLDSGPRHKFSRMTISFSPFLPFRSFENTAGNGGTFFIYQIQLPFPSVPCRQIGQMRQYPSFYTLPAPESPHHAVMWPDYTKYILSAGQWIQTIL